MNDQKLIYLDHNATTPCAAEVLDAMLPWFRADFGNASSVHVMGRRAAHAVAQARELVADTIGCADEEVFFTGGGTESNNLVITGVCHPGARRNRIVVAEIEHKSVLEPCIALSERGFDVVRIPVTSNGVVVAEIAERLINDRTLLLCIQGANNEVGTLQPVTQLCDIAREHGAFVHCDATQLLGKASVSVMDMGVDFASFSAHKVYGPKGVGALFVRRGSARTSLQPLYRGGSHERQVRPGTLNVPGIVGFGQACRLIEERLDDDVASVTALRRRFEQVLRQSAPWSRLNAQSAPRLPGSCSAIFPRVPASMLISNLPHICISDGAACSSGAPQPSHVLLAMGFSRDDADSTVRIGFGRGNTAEEAEKAATAIGEAATLLRSTLETMAG